MKKLLSDEKLVSLIRRMELMPAILQRHIEEEIVALVNLPEAWIEKAHAEFMSNKKFSESDLSKWLDETLNPYWPCRYATLMCIEEFLDPKELCTYIQELSTENKQKDPKDSTYLRPVAVNA